MEKALAKTLNSISGTGKMREDYIGRGMSKPTCGVVVDSIEGLLEDVIRNAEDFVDDGGYQLFDPGALRVDSMGKDIIIY